MNGFFYRNIINAKNHKTIKNFADYRKIPLWCITEEFSCKKNSLSVFRKEDSVSEDEILTSLLFTNENPHHHNYIRFSYEDLKKSKILTIQKTDCSSGYNKATKFHYDIYDLKYESIEKLLKLFSSCEIMNITKPQGDELLLKAYKGNNGNSEIDLSKVYMGPLFIKLLTALVKDAKVFTQEERLENLNRLNKMFDDVFNKKKIQTEEQIEIFHKITQ